MAGCLKKIKFSYRSNIMPIYGSFTKQTKILPLNIYIYVCACLSYIGRCSRGSFIFIINRADFIFSRNQILNSM